jgi:maltose O-acetyltransferase
MWRVATALIKASTIVRGIRRRFRNKYYRLVLKSMGDGCQISENIFIAGPQSISLGKNVHVNDGVKLQSCDGAAIDIGNNVTISYDVIILTGGLDVRNEINHKKHITRPVIIKDNAWLGAKSIILPGVIVGSGSLVAAGSVVTKDVADNVIVAGVPASFIRSL